MLQMEASRVVELRREINFNNRFYYMLDDPVISDPELLTADFSTQRVGGTLADGFTQVQHSTPLLSPANALNWEEHFHNRLSPWGYFLTYRAWTGFDVAWIAPDHDMLDSHKSWPEMFPSYGSILRWYQGNIELWFHSRIHC